MSAHTPGPWSIYFHTNNHRLGLGEFVIRGGAHAMPLPGTHCNQTTRERTEAEANARLIAAAPDMLALLQRYLDGEPPSTLDDDVRAVIEKARGGGK